jgi:hypothetical protein
MQYTLTIYLFGVINVSKFLYIFSHVFWEYYEAWVVRWEKSIMIPSRCSPFLDGTDASAPTSCIACTRTSCLAPMDGADTPVLTPHAHAKGRDGHAYLCASCHAPSSAPRASRHATIHPLVDRGDLELRAGVKLRASVKLRVNEPPLLCSK